MAGCRGGDPSPRTTRALLASAQALPGLLRERLDRQAFNDALEEVWKVIRAANGYIDRQAPWSLAKTDPPRMGAVLRVLADALRVIATVLQPFMPGSMGRMLDQLGVPAEARDVRGSGAATAGRDRAARSTRRFPALRRERGLTFDAGRFALSSRLLLGR